MAEVDFLLERGNAVLPVEVRAGINPRSKSLQSFDSQFSAPGLVRSTLLNLKRDGRVANIPLYALPDGLRFAGPDELPSRAVQQSALSFLGFGLPIEIPSWGGLLSREGRQYMEAAPHLAFWPGLAFVEQRIKGDKLGLDGFGQGEVHHEAAVYHTSQTDHSILARRLSPPISFGRWATHPAPVSGGRATAGRPRQRTGDRGRRAQHPRPGRAARYRIQQRPLLTRAPAASGIVILNQRRRGNHQ